MAAKAWFSPARKSNLAVLAAIFLAAAPALCFAGDLAFSAKVDKTTVSVGEPIQLTLSLAGDIEGAEVPPVSLPEGFAVLAQSRSTNFSIRAGAAERSTSLVYAIVAQRAGTFHLGPFTVKRKKESLTTEPIEITVKPPTEPVQPLKPGAAKRYTI